MERKTKKKIINHTNKIETTVLKKKIENYTTAEQRQTGHTANVERRKKNQRQ